MTVQRYDISAVTARGHRVAVKGTLYYRTSDTGLRSWDVIANVDGMPPTDLLEMRQEPEAVELEGDSVTFRGSGIFIASGVSANLAGMERSSVQINGTGALEETIVGRISMGDKPIGDD